jgi:hypothetical protein
MYTITAHAAAIFEVVVDHATEVETGPKSDKGTDRKIRR